MVGVVVAGAALAAVWIGLPRYAEGASAAALDRTIEEAGSDAVPFGYLFSYSRLSGGARSWSELDPVDRAVLDDPDTFHLPTRATSRLTESVPFRLLADGAAGGGAAADDARRDGLAFASVSNFAEHARLLAGEEPGSAVGDGPLPVAIRESLADSLDLRLGSEATAVRGSGVNQTALPIRVVGIWEPVRNGDPAGRFVGDVLARRLVISPTVFAQRVAPDGAERVENAQWLVLLDGADATTADVAPAIAAAERVTAQIDGVLRGTRLVAEPTGPLERFQARARALDRGLASFSVPLMTLLLVALALLASMAAAGRSPELAMLRRRGQPPTRLARPLLLEAVGVGVAAVVLGVIVSGGVVSALARTETFLRFGDGVDVAAQFSPRAWSAAWQAFVAVVVIHAAAALLGLRGARVDRVPTEPTARPWFQRRGLDLAIVAVVAAVVVPGLRASGRAEQLVDDPMVLLIPALTAIGVALLVVRLFPGAMALVARLVGRLESPFGTAAQLAARRAGRDRRGVVLPLVLVIVTGSLAVYTASLARTMDQQLLDEIHHRVGAAARVVDEGRAGGAGGSNTYARAADYERVWGIDAATPLAEMPATFVLPGGAVARVQLAGVDPAGFNAVAYWRADYATEPLSSLMGSLAAHHEGVLLPRATARQFGAVVGDAIDLAFTIGPTQQRATVTLVGLFDRFPTWSAAEDAPLAVVDLDLLDGLAGRGDTRTVLFAPSDVQRDPVQTSGDLRAINASFGSRTDAAVEVARAQARPERQGVFGVLTLSFLVASGLTLLGFGLHGLMRHRRQLAAFGALRALGMTRRQLTMTVATDLLLVGAVGLAVALGLGLAMSRWFLPVLIDHPPGREPELLIEVDVAAVAVIGAGMALLLLVVGTIAVVSLRRIALGEAVRL